MRLNDINGTYSFGPGDRKLAEQIENECRNLDYLIEQSHRNFLHPSIIAKELSNWTLTHQIPKELSNWTLTRQIPIINNTLKKVIPDFLKDDDIKVMAVPISLINIDNTPINVIAQYAKLAIIDTNLSDEEIINELSVCLKQHVMLNKSFNQVYAFYQPLIPKIVYDVGQKQTIPKLVFGTRYGVVDKS